MNDKETRMTFQERAIIRLTEQSTNEAFVKEIEKAVLLGEKATVKQVFDEYVEYNIPIPKVFMEYAIVNGEHGQYFAENYGKYVEGDYFTEATEYLMEMGLSGMDGIKWRNQDNVIIVTEELKIPIDISLRLKEKKSNSITKEVHLINGKSVKDVNILFGKGSKVPLSADKSLVEMYKKKGIDTNKEDWFKAQGAGVVSADGKEKFAQLHWFEHEKVGAVEIKVKDWLNSQSLST